MLGDLRYGRGLFAQLLMALALIAAGLQSGIPSGYMLERDATTGALSVVFCTGQGPATRWIELDNGTTGDHDPSPSRDSGSGQPCAFAMASAGGPLPVVDTWQPPVLQSLAGALPQAASPDTASRPLRHPVRGPPRTL